MTSTNPVYPHMPYVGRRRAVYAPNGAVATSQPLATQAGMQMLHQGGNAMDAAIAAAVALTVVEPSSCGIGGDAFALVWHDGALHGLNGSGRSPQAFSAESLTTNGAASLPLNGWLPVTTPGAPAAWIDLHRRFGKLPFATLFEPAIAYAEHGFPVAPVAQFKWARSFNKFRAGLSAESFAHWAAEFAPHGRPPRVGERWRSPGMARSLHLIAESRAESFYRGELAAEIADFSAENGGLLRGEDLAAHQSTWVDPISTAYRGVDVWELPPNGQGLAALIALNILEGFDLASLQRDSAESFHLQLEAMKLAYADAQRYIADPEMADVPTDALLSKAYAAERRALIGETALLPEPGEPVQGGTVYLCSADTDGMQVSLIESTFHGFGSGIVVPGTGIALQNRGHGFSLDPAHPNYAQPGKRPYHTIIPGFLTQDGEPIGPFGVMGGHMQPQGHVQMVVNMVDYGMGPQVSLDAPRWYWEAGRDIKVEPDAGRDVMLGLQARGHAAEVEYNAALFGNGQIIRTLPDGGYVAGSEGRADGSAAGH